MSHPSVQEVNSQNNQIHNYKHPSNHRPKNRMTSYDRHPVR